MNWGFEISVLSGVKDEPTVVCQLCEQWMIFAPRWRIQSFWSIGKENTQSSDEIRDMVVSLGAPPADTTEDWLASAGN